MMGICSTRSSTPVGIEMPVIHSAQVDDALAMAHVHVETWRTTYAGILPTEHPTTLSDERCRAGWTEHLSNPESEVHAFVAEARLSFLSAARGPARRREGDRDWWKRDGGRGICLARPGSVRSMMST